MLSAMALAEPPDLSAPHHSEHLLVRFKSGTSKETRQLVHAAVRGEVRKTYRHVSGLTLVKVSPDRLAAALTEYLDHPEVLYAEPDYQFRAAAIPNDPSFDELWGMHNTGQTGTPGTDIRAVPAWDLWIGDPDFRIAVADSGIFYDHEDFKDFNLVESNIWTNPGEIDGNGIDDDGNGYIDDAHGYNFVTDEGDPLDDWDPVWHGTHVAGTIGAFGNNSRDVVGVNWRCKIVALKIFDSQGNILISDAVDAMEYVIDNNIKLSNNSWGGGLFSQALFDAIQASQAIGHIFVASAGNEDRK